LEADWHAVPAEAAAQASGVDGRGSANATSDAVSVQGRGAAAEQSARHDEGQRQQYLEAKGLLHQAGPLAILRLVRLAGIDLETNTLIPDDQLPDPRVVLIAAQNLAERVYGRPKEMERPVAETEPAEQPTNTHVTVRFVEASKCLNLNRISCLLPSLIVFGQANLLIRSCTEAM
jgi:hypothetical protein